MGRRRPVIRPPIALEGQYARRLLRRRDAMRALVLAQMDAHPYRGDTAGTWFTAIVSAVRRVWEVQMPPSPDSLRPTATAVDAWATGNTVRAVKVVAGIDVTADPRMAPGRLADLHLQWARQNVGLIRSMESSTFDDLARAVVDAAQQGTTDLQSVIEQRFQVAGSRARLIARDQVSKLNGQVTQHRQQSLGITRYEWSTSNDERVRASHRALDGKVFDWSAPPAEGHPGQPIQCRCVALPVVDG